MASHAANPLTPAEIARIAVLHADGKTRNDIAKDLGRSGSTITAHCRKVGLSFDRTATKAATEAKQQDAGARRVAAQLAELEILELMQAHVAKVLKGEKKHRKLVRGEMGTESATDLNFLPADDAQRLNNARSSSTTIITNLARLDHDNGEHAATSLIMGIASKLGLVPDDEPA